MTHFPRCLSFCSLSQNQLNAIHLFIHSSSAARHSHTLPPSLSLYPPLASLWLDRRGFDVGVKWSEGYINDPPPRHGWHTTQFVNHQPTVSYHKLSYRLGQWLQVQYCFHLTFSEVKWESHLLRCRDCQCMTMDGIHHFHLCLYSEQGVKPPTHPPPPPKKLTQLKNEGFVNIIFEFGIEQTKKMDSNYIFKGCLRTFLTA